MPRNTWRLQRSSGKEHGSDGPGDAEAARKLAAEAGGLTRGKGREGPRKIVLKGGQKKIWAGRG